MVCSQKVVIKVLDFSPDLKEKPVLGTATVDLVPLLHDTCKIEAEFPLILHPDYDTVESELSTGHAAPVVAVTIASTSCLGSPEDLEDWNIFSVEVWSASSVMLRVNWRLSTVAVRAFCILHAVVRGRTALLSPGSGVGAIGPRVFPGSHAARK